MGSAEVLVARMAFGAFAPNSWKMAFLISSFSEAASITICTERNSTGAVEATIRARPSFAFSSVIKPRFTASA